MKVKHIGGDRDLQEFNEEFPKHGLAVVGFFAAWCGHCKTLAPIIETVAAKSHTPGSRVAIAKVDATYEQALSARFPLKGYPTVFFIKDSVLRFPTQ